LKNWENSSKKKEKKELSNRESVLIELRKALGEEWSALGRTMDDVEIRKQELEEREAKVSRRQSILAKDADEIQLGRVKNEELSKRLDEEKRKLFRVEEESKLSASRREEDLNEKEKKLSAQEEKKKVSRDCILLQDSLNGPGNWNNPKRGEILKTTEIESELTRQANVKEISDQRNVLKKAFQQVESQRVKL